MDNFILYNHLTRDITIFGKVLSMNDLHICAWAAIIVFIVITAFGGWNDDDNLSNDR